MIKLPVCGTSDLVFPYSKYGNTGHIHSIFNNSFNVIIGERLIHISGQEAFLSSFGVQLEAHQFEGLKGIQVNDLVILKENTMTIYSRLGTYILSGNANNQKKLTLFKIHYGLEEIEQLLKKLEAEIDVDQIGIEKNSAFDQIQDWMQSADFSSNKVERIVQYLFGRGLGLTPSGDDILLGYFWGMRILMDDSMKKEVNSCFIRSIMKTTIISREYVFAFLQGRISSPIFRFNQALERRSSDSIDDAIKEIKAIGHTSGQDFLFGFLLSLRCIRNIKMRGMLHETKS